MASTCLWCGTPIPAGEDYCSSPCQAAYDSEREDDGEDLALDDDEGDA